MKAHPRRCGEKSLRRRKMLAVRGSPPQVRGKERRCSMYRTLSRITPAGAGKSFPDNGFQNASEDHPRGCGEKAIHSRLRSRQKGSPPRVRGKAQVVGGEESPGGITPAGAGKSWLSKDRDQIDEDHPRGCGEKFVLWLVLSFVLGSPPRVRGKEGESKMNELILGITPAGAGKSAIDPGETGIFMDHPRGCGEKLRLSGTSPSAMGSPPRVRGKGNICVEP